jgi:hypothetical protein
MLSPRFVHEYGIRGLHERPHAGSQPAFEAEVVFARSHCGGSVKRTLPSENHTREIGRALLPSPYEGAAVGFEARPADAQPRRVGPARRPDRQIPAPDQGGKLSLAGRTGSGRGCR